VHVFLDVQRFLFWGYGTWNKEPGTVLSENGTGGLEMLNIKI
jgi:hypothetical protein